MRDLFGSRWQDLTLLEVSDSTIKVGFAAPAPVVLQATTAAPAPQPDKPTQPDLAPLNDADLALSPPAGMLVPPPPEEQN